MNHEPDVWFKHNADSISEPHMRRIRAKFGKLQGYAMYYLTTEIMIKSGGYISIEDIDAYADDYELSASALLGFFDYCVEIGLFTLEDNAYSSYVAIHTCQKRKAISEVRAESGRLGGMAKNKNKEDEPVPVPEQESKHTKDKPQKEPDHTQEIVDFWNAKADKGKCTKITGDIKKAIAKRLAEYSLDEIKGTISNYQAVVQDQSCFFSYVWNIYEFFKRDNAFLAFTGDESVLLRYQKNGNMQPPEPVSDSDPQEWTWPFPKPAEWDAWAIDDRKAYIREKVAK